MAFTVGEYIDYCKTISTQVASEPTAQPILDADMTIRILLPAVFREVARRRIKNNSQIQNLIREHRLVLSSGSSELPDGVTEEFAEFMQCGTCRDDLGLFSYIPQYFDYVRENVSLLPRFTLREGRIYAKKTVNGACVSVGKLILYALTMPEIGRETDEIEVEEAFMDDCLTLTASILRGEIPLAAIGVSNEIIGRRK